MKRMAEWLVMKSPAKLAEEKAQALQEAARASRAAAKASEQGRMDMYERAVHLKQAGDELLALLRQSQELSAGGVARVGQGVQSVGRKVDGLHESVESFLARAAEGTFGPGQAELREALEAVQSVDLVGQDVRTLSKEFDALRDLMVRALEGEQSPGQGRRGRHRKPNAGDGSQATVSRAEEREIAGSGSGEAGVGPDEEERWLW